jgi:hypothetical protein
MHVKAAVVLASFAAAAWFALAADAAQIFSAWNSAQKVDEVAANSTELNTPALDGCPIQSPDGLSLYMASNRPGGRGGLDIWVARRPNRNAPWDAPQNLGEPVNSAADDFCPTPIRNGGLFFVSREALPGACGLGDIYFTRFTRQSGWSVPQRLACAPDGPNSALDEQGPSYVASSKDRGSLYFSQLGHRPGRHLRQRRRRRRSVRSGGSGHRAERPGRERHPAERPQGRERGRLLLEPGRDSRRSGHLGRDAEERQPGLVGHHEPRLAREHGRGGVAPVALAGREAAALRTRTRSGGHVRHLRRHANGREAALAL